MDLAFHAADDGQGLAKINLGVAVTAILVEIDEKWETTEKPYSTSEDEINGVPNFHKGCSIVTR